MTDKNLLHEDIRRRLLSIPIRIRPLEKNGTSRSELFNNSYRICLKIYLADGNLVMPIQPLLN